MEQPIYEVTSHISGKNAQVRVYQDRVEWERGKSASKAKITAGVLTLGTSLLVTGVRTRKHAGVEVIPMRSITAVASRRDSMINDMVVITTAGAAIEMRCSKTDAAQLRNMILAGINGELRSS